MDLWLLGDGCYGVSRILCDVIYSVKRRCVTLWQFPVSESLQICCRKSDWQYFFNIWTISCVPTVWYIFWLVQLAGYVFSTLFLFLLQCSSMWWSAFRAALVCLMRTDNNVLNGLNLLVGSDLGRVVVLVDVIRNCTLLA